MKNQISNLLALTILLTSSFGILADEATAKSKASDKATSSTSESSSAAASTDSAKGASTSSSDANSSSTPTDATTPSSTVPAANTATTSPASPAATSPANTNGTADSQPSHTDASAKDADKWASVKKELADEEKKLSDTKTAQVVAARKQWTVAGPRISQLSQLVEAAATKAPTHPNVATMRSVLGITYISAGMYSEARVQLESSIAGVNTYLHGNNSFNLPESEMKALVKLNALSRVHLADVYILDKKYSDAKSAIELAIPVLTNEAKTDPKSSLALSKAYDELAIAVGKNGDYEKASQDLMEAKRSKAAGASAIKPAVKTTVKTPVKTLVKGAPAAATKPKKKSP